MAETKNIGLEGLSVFKEEIDTLLTGKIDTSQKAVANGLASLDSTGKVPASQLPSYLDDVLEGYLDDSYLVESFSELNSYNAGEIVLYLGTKYRFKVNHDPGIFTPAEMQKIDQFPAEGEAGKIYSDIITNKTYRWSGSTYTQIKGDLAIGTTTGTAFDGAAGAAMQQKVNGIAAGAEVNTINTVKVNGTPLTPDGNRAVNIEVPTTQYATEAEIRSLFHQS